MNMYDGARLLDLRPGGTGLAGISFLNGLGAIAYEVEADVPRYEIEWLTDYIDQAVLQLRSRMESGWLDPASKTVELTAAAINVAGAILNKANAAKAKGWRNWGTTLQSAGSATQAAARGYQDPESDQLRRIGEIEQIGLHVKALAASGERKILTADQSRYEELERERQRLNVAAGDPCSLSNVLIGVTDGSTTWGSAWACVPSWLKWAGAAALGLAVLGPTIAAAAGGRRG